jgi:hypothetical protein
MDASVILMANRVTVPSTFAPLDASPAFVR